MSDRGFDLDLPTVMGAVAAVVGLAMVLDAELAAGLSPTSLLVSAVGLLALFQGVRVAFGRARTGLKQAALPEVERRQTPPSPGASFDRELEELVGRPPWSGDHQRTAVRRRLRATAIDVLTTHGGYTEPAAREALDAGTWTDDPDAAAFFAPDARRPGVVVDRARQALRLEPTFTRRARAAAVALDACAGGER